MVTPGNRTRELSGIRSFHSIAPSQIVPINSQIVPQDSQLVPQKSQFVPHMLYLFSKRVNVIRAIGTWMKAFSELFT